MAAWCPLSLGALSMCLVCLLVNPALSTASISTFRLDRTICLCKVRASRLLDHVRDGELDLRLDTHFDVDYVIQKLTCSWL